MNGVQELRRKHSRRSPNGGSPFGLSAQEFGEAHSSRRKLRVGTTPCPKQIPIAIDDQGYLEEMLVQEIKNRVDKAMTPEQFTQVVDAILDGKYSWACVLILRFAGYNPLHYIPYRTYNRLMKENNDLRQQGRSRRDEKEQQPETKLLRNCFNRLENLSCLEVLDEKSGKICGGDSNYFSHHSWKLCLKDHWM